jgi:hypothetical protein
MRVLCPRLNELIQIKSKGIQYNAAEIAPDTYPKLRSNAGQLTVWTGASEQTIFGDPRLNWAFRALHDLEHIKHSLSFSIDHELHLARITAAQFDGRIADIVYAEIGGQIEYLQANGKFPQDQYNFILNYIKGE